MSNERDLALLNKIAHKVNSIYIGADGDDDVEEQVDFCLAIADYIIQEKKKARQETAREAYKILKNELGNKKTPNWLGSMEYLNDIINE